MRNHAQSTHFSFLILYFVALFFVTVPVRQARFHSIRRMKIIPRYLSACGGGNTYFRDADCELSGSLENMLAIVLTFVALLP